MVINSQVPMMAYRGVLILVMSMAVIALLAACSGEDGEDRPGVQVINESGSGSVSQSISGSVSGSVSQSVSGSVSQSVSGSVSQSVSGSVSQSVTKPGDGEVYDAIGGYTPASNVVSHSLVVNDVAEINELLGASPIDWAAVEKLYTEGKNSVKGSGSIRTIAGYARNDSRSEPIWDDYTSYYNDQTWLDTFVTSAIEGTGPFAGESDAVRKQGAQKGIQNQIMISWAIHELVAAMAKAEDGNFDAETGAPHNWDEVWAFYHGENPNGGPHATANKRGGNFGTSTMVNNVILAAMNSGRDALLDGDVAGAQSAMDEIIKQIRITYIQASIRYASKIGSDLESGDAEKARIHQAEGLAFYRVIEPMVAQADAEAAATIAGYYDLSSEPNALAGPAVQSALESVYEAWDIKPSDVGTLGGSAIGGYTPVSDVVTHSRVVSDVAEINKILGASPIDWAAVEKLYTEGKNSVKSNGSIRTIAGYARNDSRSEPIWDDYTSYYNDQTWLDTFVTSAIEGTGPFAGESDAVRKQGAQKGIQNQIMISWAIHELVAAMAKAEDGNFDAETGAPHNWDEVWAFYHGENPNGGPHATANKRGGNFGTSTMVNNVILAAMNSGRDALLDGDVAGAQSAMDEIIKQIRITYIQASIRYASKIGSDLESGDAEKARIHQAEGLAFYRVIEPMVAQADAEAAATIAGYYDLSSEPNALAGPAVQSALESVYDTWGISTSDVGTLQ
ncbi:MAG: hypothetical protein FI699_00840 [SAR202 cluster bacterium]|nr:hypothetical protein [SAR202 cluster bacterium]